MELSAEEKKILLKAARDSIQTLFNHKPLPKVDLAKHPVFNLHAGAFVTLTLGGKLRGCIGYIISEGPLFKTVCDAAIQAASSDPRFYPLTEAEFEKIEIEISILSEPFPMKKYDDIIIGKHGLILNEKGRRGLLLPQVPVEYNMNRDEYLSALCQKAGFDKDFWKERTLNISMFTATVFSEKEMGV